MAYGLEGSPWNTGIGLTFATFRAKVWELEADQHHFAGAHIFQHAADYCDLFFLNRYYLVLPL